jgi:hypothetical protein
MINPSFPNKGKALVGSEPIEIASLQNSIPKPTGCTLLLKNGNRVDVDGLSITQAKAMRRLKLPVASG